MMINAPTASPTTIGHNEDQRAHAGHHNHILTHLRVLLVLRSMTAAFWPTELASLGSVPPTEATQTLVLWFGYCDTIGNTWAIPQQLCFIERPRCRVEVLKEIIIAQ